MKKGTDKPWVQQPGESGPAFEAFTIFRDLGPGRTFAAVSEKCGKSIGLIYRWKDKWNWRERAIAYDSSIAEEARRKAVKEQQDMESRHIVIAMQLQKKALEALVSLGPDEMSPKDIKEFFKLATELERLTRSEQHITQQQNTGTGSSLADDIVSLYGRRMGDEDD